MSIIVWGKSIPCYRHGTGDIPLLVLGPATLFFNHAHQFAGRFFELFTVYFADIFAGTPARASDYTTLTLSDFVEMVEQIRQSLGLAQCAVFAHSALGVLAIEYVRRYPASVLQNILVGTSPIWGASKVQVAECFFKNNAAEDRKALFSADIAERQREQDRLHKAHAVDLPQSLFISQYGARRAHFFYNPYTAQPDRFWDDMVLDTALIDHYFSLLPGYMVSAESFPAVPTFIALGLYDASVPCYLWTDEQRALLLLPQVAYYIFSESGHYPMWENAPLFVEKLEHWLCSQGTEYGLGRIHHA